MLKTSALVFLIYIGLAAGSVLFAQTFSPDLNGFRLGQTRSVTHKELGRPDQTGNTDEDVGYEAFLLNEDPALYMVFQYRNVSPEIIWSIQITGADGKHDLGFNGLRLGMTPSDVEKQLGKPSRKISAAEHGTRWEFDNRNVSVEIGSDNKLSSVRIVDDRTKEPDLKNFPKFPELLTKFRFATNTELADILAPDMELYDAGRVRSFEWPLKKEISQDTSGVFAAIRRLSKDLAAVDTSKPDQYEERLRVQTTGDTQRVFRFLKLGSEIAFRWNGEQWQIWEFGTKPSPPPPEDWKSIYKPGSLRNLISVRVPELISQPNVALTKDDGKPLASFSYNSYPTSTRVKFTGESRKTPESTLTLISLWLETLGKPKELARRFESEFKFVENDVEYWLPVQNPLPERFAKELTKNGDVTIYLSWIGAKFEGDKPDLLAVINEFAAVGK
jgi:hypothetical protein